MEEIKIENKEQNLEQIKDELRAEWNNIVEDLITDENFLNNNQQEILEKEFDKILEIYEKQKRSLAHYQNLKIALDGNKESLNKLAEFYKNINYEKDRSWAENKIQSMEFARQFLTVLGVDEKDKKKFTSLF